MGAAYSGGYALVVTRPKPLFIISDGTGDTAEKVVHACLLQFEGAPVQPQTYPNVQDIESLRRLFDLAANHDAFVVTTLVRGEHRDEAARLAQKHRIQHVDIVLVGISRTSKTPLSVFLAHKGYRVGNVPLVLDQGPPEALWDVDPRRVFALTIDPSALQNIRLRRLEVMRMSDRTNYGQIDYIMAELDFAHDLFDRNRDWPVIDVTNKAVEETAATILKTLAERGLAHHISEVGQL